MATKKINEGRGGGGGGAGFWAPFHLSSLQMLQKEKTLKNRIRSVENLIYHINRY